jgi:signal transduction histidine kinase
MGLTLVQLCVRLLGGDVIVDSRPGEGSEFRVRLPDALAEPAGDVAGDQALGTLH